MLSVTAGGQVDYLEVDGVYEWVIEFQCHLNKKGTGISFTGINFYSRSRNASQVGLPRHNDTVVHAIRPPQLCGAWEPMTGGSRQYDSHRRAPPRVVMQLDRMAHTRNP